MNLFRNPFNRELEPDFITMKTQRVMIIRQD